MPILVSCGCGKKYQAPDGAAGKFIRCKQCQAVLTVPAAAIVAKPVAASASTNYIAGKPIVAQPIVAQLVKPGGSPSAMAAGQPVVARPVQPSVPSEPLAVPLNSPALPPFDSRNSYPSSDISGYSVPAPTSRLSRPAAPRPGKSDAIPASQWFTGMVVVGGCFLFAAIGCVLLYLRKSDPSSLGGSTSPSANSVLPGMSPRESAAFEAGLQYELQNRMSVEPSPAPGMSHPLDTVRRPDFNQTLAGGVRLGQTRGRRLGGQVDTQMKVYLPPGPHADKSLGCILVAPAGTNLLLGSAVDDGDYHDESLPYAQAGYAVVQYSLDGDIDLETASMSEVQKAFHQFRESSGGLRNAQHVMDFLKFQMPEIDPTRIFVAGHSSAGTIALMVLAQDPRVAGAIAYAPCTDPVAFHRDYESDPSIQRVFSGYRAFDLQNSPILSAVRMRKPLMVFQARDDSVVSVAETRRFVDRVKQTNPGVEYVEVASGDHYDSMIQQGIPAGIAWLKKQDSR